MCIILARDSAYAFFFQTTENFFYTGIGPRVPLSSHLLETVKCCINGVNMNELECP